MINIDNYIIQNYDGTYKSIASMMSTLNLSQSSVYRKLHKMNIYSPQKKSKYSFNESFFNTWSASMAYIIGFIMADGCIYAKRNVLTISIHEKDVEILDFIKTTVDANHPVRRYNTKTTPAVNLTLVSKIMIEDLRKLGIEDRKTNRLVIPKDIPKQYFHDFIRGLFDGDGTAILKRGKELHANIVSVNYNFLKDICDFYGFGHISCNRQDGHLPLYTWFLSQQDCWKFRDLIYYDQHPFSLSRKRSILLTNMDREKSWWRPYELDYLTKNYGIKNYRSMSLDLNRSYNAIRFKIKHMKDLGLIKGV